MFPNYNGKGVYHVYKVEDFLIGALGAALKEELGTIGRHKEYAYYFNRHSPNVASSELSLYSSLSCKARSCKPISVFFFRLEARSPTISSAQGLETWICDILVLYCVISQSDLDTVLSMR